MKVKRNSELAIARGKRVKITRQIVGLTRIDMLKKYNIKLTTLQYWEEGFNPINEEKAQLLANIFLKEGINITAQWILSGSNNPSGSEIEDQNDSDKSNQMNSYLTIQNNALLADEIKHFKEKITDSIVAIIEDDALWPLFNKEDFVGGINLYGNHIQSLIGNLCIITLKTGKTFIRKILKYHDNDYYTIGLINPYSKMNEPVSWTEDEDIKAAAKITRHWLTGKE